MIKFNFLDMFFVLNSCLWFENFQPLALAANVLSYFKSVISFCFGCFFTYSCLSIVAFFSIVYLIYNNIESLIHLSGSRGAKAADLAFKLIVGANAALQLARNAGGGGKDDDNDKKKDSKKDSNNDQQNQKDGQNNKSQTSGQDNSKTSSTSTSTSAANTKSYQ
jgi:hypothetical protein